MLRAAHLIVAAVAAAVASAELCSAQCEAGFELCINFPVPASRCRNDIDRGFHRMRDAGCEPGCESTEGMIAMAEDSDEDAGGKGKGAGGEPCKHTKDDYVEPTEKPTTPTLCAAANEGRCYCANLNTPAETWRNHMTYTWWVGTDQRCATLYVPSSAPQPAPVLVQLNCYACDKLEALEVGASSDLLQARAGMRAGMPFSKKDGHDASTTNPPSAGRQSLRRRRHGPLIS